MNLSRAATVLVGLLLFAPAASADPPVNFSGTWHLDKSRSVLPPSIPSSGDMTLIIDHQGDTLTIDRRVQYMGMNMTIKSTYYTDGRESSNKTPRGQTFLSRSRWDGSSLVTESRSAKTTRDGHPTDEATDVKKLEDNGKVLVVDGTLKRPGKDPQRAVSVYVKQ